MVKAQKLKDYYFRRTLLCNKAVSMYTPNRANHNFRALYHQPIDISERYKSFVLRPRSCEMLGRANRTRINGEKNETSLWHAGFISILSVLSNSADSPARRKKRDYEKRDYVQHTMPSLHFLTLAQ